MRVIAMNIASFRQFSNCRLFFGKKITAIAGNNGTGKSTILGLLANSSQYPKHKTLLGKPYRGEFSELFKGSVEHDKSGQKISMRYNDGHAESEVSFRTAWQNNGSRFRIIPKRTTREGKITESKINSPVIYLGLSRLYPIGESDAKIEQKNFKWRNEEEQKWFVENYKKILSVHEKVKSVGNLSINGLSHKSGTGIETERYSPITNSAGQDNLGQILMSVLSFKRLSTEVDDWNGGLLLIDEIDASLHPAAQLRLIALFLKEAGRAHFQIIFTTHSTTVLKKLSEMNQSNRSDRPGDVEVAYLTDATGKLEVKRNPSWIDIYNDLFVSNSVISSPGIEIFTEDEEANWLFDELLKASDSASSLRNKIRYSHAKLGCKEILKLYINEWSFFRNKIVVLDGDVSEEDIASIPPAVREGNHNLLTLPGQVRPESVIWDFLKDRPSSDEIWVKMKERGVDWKSFVENGPKSCEGDNERDKYKKWFNMYKNIFTEVGVVKNWINENREEYNAFINAVDSAYKEVSRRIIDL